MTGYPVALSNPFLHFLFPTMDNEKVKNSLSLAAKGSLSLPSENQQDICCRDLGKIFPAGQKERSHRTSSYHLDPAPHSQILKLVMWVHDSEAVATIL